MRSALRGMASAVVALVFLAPLLWMLGAALREGTDLFHADLARWFTMDGWTFAHFTQAWRRADLGHALVVSLLQVAAIAGGGLLINTPAAYAFARMEFRGRNILFAVVVGLIILPLEALAVPLFLTVRDTGLTGGVWPAMGGLILPFLAKAFNIYFLRQQFLLLPQEYEEAAVMAGAGPWQRFCYVALPAVKPALATVVILDVLTHWGDFLWPLMVSTREETRTVQLGLANLFTQPPIDWGDIMACAVIATLPVMAIFHWIQRHLAAAGMQGTTK